MTSVQELVAATRDILAERAVTEFDPPIELASGQLSRFFVDGKAGLSRAEDLRVACQAIDGLVTGAGITYDAVGGLTLGADHLAVGTSLVGGKEWFFVRKKAKDRGTAQRVEGAKLGAGVRVLVVDDVVSTGGSLFEAVDAIEATGATIVAAATLLDRGDYAGETLERKSIPYFPLTSFRDFGMAPVAAA